MFAGDQGKGKTRIDYLRPKIESLTDFSHEIKHAQQYFTFALAVALLYLDLSLHPKYELQGVKWEDTSKKEEKEDILLEKENKKRTYFSLNIIQQKQKSIKFTC